MRKLTITLLLAAVLPCFAPTGYFLVAWDDVAGVPILPPMVADSGPQLRWTNALKQIEGGYVASSQVGRGIKKATVLVNASSNVLAWIGTNCLADLRTEAAKSNLLAVSTQPGQTNACVACGAKAKAELCPRCADLAFEAAALDTQPINWDAKAVVIEP